MNSLTLGELEKIYTTAYREDRERRGFIFEEKEKPLNDRIKEMRSAFPEFKK